MQYRDVIFIGLLCLPLMGQEHHIPFSPSGVAAWADCDGSAFPCKWSFENSGCAADNITGITGTVDCDETVVGVTAGSEALDTGPNAADSQGSWDNQFDDADYTNVLWIRFSARWDDLATVGYHVILTDSAGTATPIQIRSDNSSGNLKVGLECNATVRWGAGITDCTDGLDCNLEFKLKIDHTDPKNCILYLDGDEDFTSDNFSSYITCVGNPTGVNESEGIDFNADAGSINRIIFDRVCVSSEDVWTGCFP